MILDDIKDTYIDLIGEKPTLKILKEAKKFESYQRDLKSDDYDEYSRLYREYFTSLCETYRKENGL